MLHHRLWQAGLVGAGVLAAVLLAVAGGRAVYDGRALASASHHPAHVVADGASVAPVLHYQGRLLDPASGVAKPDGAYAFTFSLYETPTGSAALWTESKTLTVARGHFATLLGDGVPLDVALFDGRILYLGVTVGNDSEAVPRQRIASVAYAIHALHADRSALADQAAHATYAASAATAGQATSAANAANAEQASHALTAAQATQAISANHAISATHAAQAAHAAQATHATTATTANTASGAGLAENSLKLDGKSAADFALANHNHDSLYVRKSGDAMTAALTVPKIVYSAPRVGYVSVAAEAFQPEENRDYRNNGGAFYTETFDGHLFAPVQLPHGATITGLSAFYIDDATADLHVSLMRRALATGLSDPVASVSSTGTDENIRKAEATTVAHPLVDNTQHAYYVAAQSQDWPGDDTMQIKGVVISYTIPEAP